MPVSKGRHLVMFDRRMIEDMLRDGESVGAIAGKIGVSWATVAREIKRHRTRDTTHYQSLDKNLCQFRDGCRMTGVCRTGCNSRCAKCASAACNRVCEKYVEVPECPKLSRAPYVCNGCRSRIALTCRNRCWFYDADAANEEAAWAKVAGRQGVDCTPEELAAMVSRSQLPADRRAAIKLHEERGEAAESRRLLYVALTRAKEALVVSMRGKSSKVDATGLSKSCWGDVQSALVGECCAFEPGVSMFDFGGQRPAHVECMHLTPADVEELLGGAAGVAGDAADGVELQVDGRPGVDEAAAGVSPDGFAADGGSGVGEAALGGCPVDGKPGMIALPVVRPYEPERGKPYEGARAGMFSYSSIAEDGGGFVDFSVEDAADDASSASLGARDADAATSLGTAFHRLAQLAALTWRPGCAFERSDVVRQRALERSCGLSAEQRDRLDAALERWFASDIAARVGVCESVSAEAPFLVRVGGPRDAAYLEGEIDLLACVAPAGTREQPAGSALVVDYKTGGSPAETAEQLHEKHLLQATCYAYAVLMEGYAQVECVFVRVEQDRADAPGQPQTVSYRFDAADAEEMGRALARAYHGHGQL